MTTSLKEVLAAARASDRLDIMRSHIREAVAEALGGKPASEIATDQPMRELGLSSMRTVTVYAALGEALDETLNPALAFQYPTIDALAGYLVGDDAPTASPSTDSVKPSPSREAGDDEIAVVGMACRFPGGVCTADELWSLLEGGVDAITEVPASRWDIDDVYDADASASGKMITRMGGFVDDVDGFDAAFFSISPREASSMDPQQRVLLEVAWEALENAGQRPDQLGGSSVGIFVGATYNDYVRLVGDIDSNPAGLDLYAASGTTNAVLAGRLAYFLDVNGPALSVDTACSSSLTATHLAVRSLRSGESSMAVAAGINLLLSPETHVCFSKAGMLSPDGHCKTFDASANGYVRSEGCGVIVLKRLRDARAAGDRVLAIIRGTAINQDGRSNGLTAPNGLAQRAVIRDALADAGVGPLDIDYVEAHGTGTPLGDPVEIEALAAALTEGRDPQRPLVVGAIKSNIGHTEAAAGMAGLIKTVLALQHDRVPPNLHLNSINPLVQPHTGRIELPTEARTLGGKGLAGISSFGFSGTNAHVIVGRGDPPPTPAPAPTETTTRVFTMSARTPVALDELIKRHLHSIGPDDDHRDLCWSSTTTRATFGQRIALPCDSTEELIDALKTLGTGDRQRALVPPGSEPRVAFLFSGQGAQAEDMGRELYDRHAIYRESFDECASVFDAETGESLVDIVYPQKPSPSAADARIHETRYTQPALYAMEVALAALWRAWGIEPAAVLGHSVGEIAAAAVSGAVSIEDGMRLIVTRARLMQELPEGTMVAVSAPVAEVEALVAPHAASVSISGLNGPESVVISGAPETMNGLIEELQRRDMSHKRLKVQRAFHSPLVEPIMAPLDAVAVKIETRAPQIPWVLNHTGEVATALEDNHWSRHAREPVRFADGVRRLIEQGCTILLEVGPHPVLLPMASSIDREAGLHLIPSLRRRKGGERALFEAVANLYLRGLEIDWRAVEKEPRQRVALPTYPFEHRTHWVHRKPSRRVASGGAPWIGAPLSSPLPAQQHHTMLDAQASPYSGHIIDGEVVVSATALIAMALTAARAKWPDANILDIHDLAIERRLALPEGQPREVHTILSPDERLQIFSRDGESWTENASAQVHPAPRSPPTFDLDALRSRIKEPVDTDTFYRDVDRSGLALADSYRSLQQLWCGVGEALGRVEGTSARDIDPGALDSCMQIALALGHKDDTPGARMVVGAERFRMWGPLRGTMWCHAVERAGGGSSTLFDLTVLNETGAILAEVRGWRLVDLDALRDPLAHEMQWTLAEEAKAENEPSTPQRWFLIGGEAHGEHLARALREAGHSCELRDADAELQLADLGEGAVHVVHLAGLSQDDAQPIEAVNTLYSSVTELARVCSSRPAETQLSFVAGAALSARSLAGFAACLALERPQLQPRCIHLADEAGERALSTELLAKPIDSRVMLSTAGRHVARLRPARGLNLSHPSALTAGTVLVTGGLGGLGMSVCEWLLGHGAQRVVLMGRSAPDPSQAKRLEALGDSVTTLTGDVTQREDLERVLQTIDAGNIPLRGIIHAAGIVDDRIALNQSWQQAWAVMAPKVAGAWHLHMLSKGRDLDFFVLFSSIAATVGSAGQTGYAAANAFMDELAAFRRARSLPATSIAWGPWAEVGMAAEGEVLRSWEERGFAPLATADALLSFGRALNSDSSPVILASIAGTDTNRGAAPDDGPQSASAASTAAGWVTTLSGLSDNDAMELIATHVCAVAVLVLGMDEGEEIHGAQRLDELGVDSLLALDLVKELETMTQLSIPPTLVFEYPTIDDIAEYLSAQLTS